MHEDDPPVYVSDPSDDENWIRETPSISMFALTQMLQNVKFSETTSWSANGEATDDALAAIARTYGRLDFPDLHWPAYPTRFYGGRDLLIATDGETWIWISGRSKDCFENAVELVVGNGVEFVDITR